MPHDDRFRPHLLVSSIVGEITGTVSLSTASIDRNVWWIGVRGGYVFAFAMLSVALAQGLPLGVAYRAGPPSGSPSPPCCLVGSPFKEPLNWVIWVMCLGFALIVGGVLLIEFGSAH